MAKQPEKRYKTSGKTVSFTLPSISRPNTARLSNFARSRAAIALAIVGLAFAGGYAGAELANRNDGNVLTTTTINDQNKVVTSESQLISKIAKDVGPSVVSVNVTINERAPSGYDIFGIAPPSSGTAEAAGTGIIISTSGVIVTNRHVVPEGTAQVSVTLSDGTELKNVSIIGRTNDNDNLDVAFLKINDTKGKKLVAAKIGDSGSAQVGDDVIAIGNALGQFQNSVTSGIVSGFGRSVTASDSSGLSSSADNLDNLLQTDAAINEGNSGGPLVNLNGQVIGINTAVAGNAQNIGFAIPINDVKGLIKQVLAKGTFERPYLGVRYVLLDQEIAAELDIKTTSGAYIAPSNNPDSPSVLVNGPADKAGLQERDIITHVDSTKIDRTHSLSSLLAQHLPGDRVKLTVMRGEKTLDVSVTLEALPDSAR
jgi:serine protease Do